MQFIRKQSRVARGVPYKNYSQTPKKKSEANQLAEFFISRIESAKHGNYREVGVCEIVKATIENGKSKT